jgi:phosphoribosylaminoimidazole carboxylase
MLAASASLLNVGVVILDIGDNGPAKQVVSAPGPHLLHVDGSFSDPEKIRELASKVDVLTVEIEHVDATVLESVRVPVHPSPSTIKIIQDKFQQKQHLLAHDSPVSDFVQVDSTVQSLHDAASELGLPLMVKSRTLAYDGRGNFVLRELVQAEDAIVALGNRPLYAEKWVPFAKEIAVMVVRTISGDVQSYPVVETIHRDNICHLVFAPLRSRDPTVASRAQSVAETAVKGLQGAGVFGVEMFLMENGKHIVGL